MKIAIPVIIKNNANRILLIAPLAALVVSLVCLYALNPVDGHLWALHSLNPVEQYNPIDPRLSFELMWKGRTFELFFVWLVALELILGWESLRSIRLRKQVSIRTALFLISLVLPTAYILIANYAGLNTFIVDVSRQSGVFWVRDMPIAIEYLALAAIFGLMTVLSSGLKGLKDFSIPILFATVLSAVFIVDSIYPQGQFTPFQFLVPLTTSLAANTIAFLGYPTTLGTSINGLPNLTVTDPTNPLKYVSFDVAWPCAGIESLLIFAVTVSLFLKRMPISWKAKIGYFAIGALITYFINIFRIAAIFLYSLGGGDANFFHQSVGPLFPIAWIVAYPLIVLGSQSLWRKIRVKNNRQPPIGDIQDHIANHV